MISDGLFLLKITNEKDRELAINELKFFSELSFSDAVIDLEKKL